MIKPGVDLRGISPQMVLAFTIAQHVYGKYGYDCVITSCSDGVHGPNSLHYKGQALDLRTKNVSRVDLSKIYQELVLFLGDQFDVVLEGDHIHVEFDPKEKDKVPDEA